MIQRINTVSFGNSPIGEIKTGVRKAQITRDQMIEGTVGTGGAVAIANGNKVIKAVAGVSQKTSKTVAQVSKNTKNFQNIFLRTFQSAEAIKGLGWIAKAAKTPAVRGFGKVFGGFAAVGLCATDFANIINTGSKIYDGERFKILDNFGK